MSVTKQSHRYSNLHHLFTNCVCCLKQQFIISTQCLIYFYFTSSIIIFSLTWSYTLKAAGSRNRGLKQRGLWYSTTLLQHIRCPAFKTRLWRCTMNILWVSHKGEPSQQQSNHTMATGLLTAARGAAASHVHQNTSHIIATEPGAAGCQVTSGPVSRAGAEDHWQINGFYQRCFNLCALYETGICCTGTIKKHVCQAGSLSITGVHHGYSSTLS